jgi:lysophospholipase L1-like esterase
MPVLEEFDDPHCQRLYERAEQAATNAGIDIISVVDGFVGTPYTDFVKEGQRWDMCHPNSAGHQRIAEGLAAGLTPVLQSLSEKL